MPSCCLAVRTLCRSLRLHRNNLHLHHHHHHLRPFPPLRRASSIASAGQHERAPAPSLDLNKVSSDSAYLDFLLGPSDDGPATERLSSREEGLSDNRANDHEQDAFVTSAPVAEKQRSSRRVRNVVSRHGERQQKLQSVQRSPQKSFHQQHDRLHSQSGNAVRSRAHPLVIRRAIVEKSARHGARSRSDRGNHHSRTERPRPPIQRELLMRRPLMRPAILRYSPRPDDRTTALIVPRPHQESWMKNVIVLCTLARKGGLLSRTPGRRSDKSSPAPIVPPVVFDLVDDVYSQLKDQPGSDLDSLFVENPQQWQYVLLWFLHHDSAIALDFLMATSSRRVFTPSACRYLAQALQCLAAQYWYGDEKANLKRLADTFLALTRDGHSRSKVFTHGIVYRALSDHFSDEALSAIYGDLKTFHHRHVHWSTWLRFASTFSNRQKGDQSLDALLESKHAGAKVDSLQFRKVCSSLLRETVSMPGGLRACIRIVDAMFRIGVTLNNNLANIIMLNAVEAGDIKTAMDIYQSLRDHGLQPDTYTFAILLKACKTHIDDAEMLNSTIRAAIDGIDVLKAPVVATEILHCLALHHVRTSSPEQVFHTVVDAYDQLFTIEPLRLVGLLTAKLARGDRHRDGARPAPRAQDIYMVLSTYLEQSISRDKSVASAYDTWQRFKHVIEAGEEPFASMKQTDHIFNAFLSTFTKTSKGMLHAAEVIRYMQLPDEAGAKYRRMRPTVQTWSIFLHGFTRHGQLRLAEQVLGYMRGKGIQPNTVTYNSLLSGYVAQQDLDGTLNTIRRLETDGLTWDTWTRRYIDKAKDKAAIEAEMRRTTSWRTLDFTADLKQNLEMRIEAFAPTAQLHVRAEENDANEGHRGEQKEQVMSQQANLQEEIAEAYFDDNGT